MRAGRLPADTVAAMAAAVLLLAIMGWGFNFFFWHVWLWFGGFRPSLYACLKEQAVRADATPRPRIWNRKS